MLGNKVEEVLVSLRWPDSSSVPTSPEPMQETLRNNAEQVLV